MKLSLVVAAGVHTGKVIPVSVTEFKIGRDPDCQLRPASPSISKKHCAIVTKEEKVFVIDFGSTNGTFVNNEQVAGERELRNDDYFKAGPLEFKIKIEGVVQAKPAPQPVAVAANDASTVTSHDDADAMAMLMLTDGEDPSPSSSGNSPTAEASIPDGTTIMDVPAVPGEKKDDKKSKGFNADTAGAAASILSKYMRRPRT
ncbi:FHA domain-containing protein [Telmatocola sphagniphila]|jgi:predicted component of type VI protein secretion system|uniref:FHA domain-containing protein n=1 Tax=Telmatocola sphagniphila TaxID=1123043 RepID=A0A8E6EXX3_9BACT|nr:FHA domain-containing protein [Telmatocola sphagniphila]QVL31766.1 FHA domain-containing protein [Telmatocola sphagniphila]